MDAETLGRRSVVLDAAYCAIIGSIVVGTRRPLGATLGASPLLVSVAGGATVAWSALVASLCGGEQWRTSVGAVATANTLAAAVLLAAAARHERPRAKVLLGMVGIEVAGFAVSQLVALRLQPKPSPTS
ncbi:MAG: hypothetical protein H0V69_08660 [Acidimicrobiia bacterium]|nr:hypothetical protein [Acidimicrobiia bacterium]